MSTESIWRICLSQPLLRWLKLPGELTTQYLGKGGAIVFLEEIPQQSMLSNEREEKFKEEREKKFKKEKEEVHCDLTCILGGIIQETTQKGSGMIDSIHHHHYSQFQLIE